MLSNQHSMWKIPKFNLQLKSCISSAFAKFTWANLNWKKSYSEKMKLQHFLWRISQNNATKSHYLRIFMSPPNRKILFTQNKFRLERILSQTWLRIESSENLIRCRQLFLSCRIMPGPDGRNMQCNLPWNIRR